MNKEERELIKVIVHNLNVLADAIKRVNDKIGGVNEEDILGHKVGFYPISGEDIDGLKPRDREMDKEK